MEIKELRSEMITRIRAKNPLMVIETFEETRALNMLMEIAGDSYINRKVIKWTITQGSQEYPAIDEVIPADGDPMSALIQIENETITEKGIIYALLDFNKYLEEPAILRKVRDLAISLKTTSKTIVFISPEFKIPGDLSKSIAIFDLPYPSKDEIEQRIISVLKGIGDQIQREKDKLIDHPERAKQINAKLTELLEIEKKICSQWKENKTALIDACLGLTDEEIESLFSGALIKRDLNISAILSEKKQIIKKSGALEYFDTTETLSGIGGLNNLKRYAQRASKMFSKEAREYGIISPRGILLVGAPGVGKSLFAKAISNVMNQPLLKMDMTAQRSKWFGETGQTMIRALKTAHAIQPAILWIDEIDKSISRSEGMSMHEESAGTLGTLLTDMEEKPGLFFLATCNNPINLPPELLSRFQKIFFVDLPTESERSEIFSIQIAGVKRDPKNYDLAELAKRSPGYSGREIRNIIHESLSISFDMGSDLTTEIISDQIAKITPVSVQKKQEIENMRAWSAKNAELASDAITPVKMESSRSLEL